MLIVCAPPPPAPARTALPNHCKLPQPWSAQSSCLVRCRVQPIKETADKQAALWCQLILQYCKYHKVHLVFSHASTVPDV